MAAVSLFFVPFLLGTDPDLFTRLYICMPLFPVDVFTRLSSDHFRLRAPN